MSRLLVRLSRKSFTTITATLSVTAAAALLASCNSPGTTGAIKPPAIPIISQTSITTTAPVEPSQAPSSAATPAPSSGISTSRTSTATGGTTTPQPVPGVSGTSGWELNAGNTGLGRLGTSCDQLARYTGPDRPGAGSVISGKRIESTLDLSAGNITVERSCVRPTQASAGSAVITTTDNNNCGGDSCAVTPAMVTIRDSEIDGSRIDANTISKSCAFLGVGTIERNYIHDVGSGICFFNTGDRLNAVAQGNYVHKLRAYGDAAGSGSHNEALTIRDFGTDRTSGRQASVVNNRLDSSSGNDTGALFIQPYGGNINNVLVSGNLLEGMGYQLILEANYGNVYGRSMRAINNRFSGTGYGPTYITRNGLSYGWAEWRDNSINAPGAPANQGRIVNEPN